MAGKGVSRFGVSVPPELLTEFDETIARMGYDRSKAIQLAMRNFLSEYMWKYEEEGVAAGTMTIIYDHEVKGLEESLTDTQHLYRNIVSSAMHIHLDEQNCLLVIAVKGKVKAIQNLAKELMSKRGIKQLKLATVIS
ncbi:nickel-responsive transcriptional regulator NikR [Candidatus Bathyarchaeota archaeon]|nr:MAG: nickel-responsive transcriptional regulator NikR [Candidatus Bathyarchaeota archaeon]